ncbi:DnaJ-domain-containing protein [Neolentinus lepideus HHB14362 ss-1]|uniref:DnaJ-domain-containing protein n=1 Tax=Neolentinus lepideus HHB14362 ss-1 TaxID=1314782 RepID=A0A165U939_9AGAM|nr:DnaJ-domain-containing protein [Neolentinus lepideus HHB14362 ss-1]
MTETNLYETLDIAKDASPDDIRRAYKKAALKTHPDRLGPNITPAEKAVAEEQFRRVNHAYEVLNNPENRRIYDMYGRWPPPNATEEPQPRASTHQGNPWGAFDSPFSDPFFNFTDPFGGSRRHFAFTDPFELFNSIFGDIHRRSFDDPFLNELPAPFGGARRSRDPFDAFGGGSMMSPFGGLLGSSMFSPFQQMADSRNANMRSASFTSIGFDNGQERQWVSQSKMTRTINGVTESVWKRTDSDGNEHVTLTYPDGRQRYTINGVEQPADQDNRYLQDSRPDRYLPPPTQQPAQVPFTPPPSYYAEPKPQRSGYEPEPRHSSSSRHSYSSSHAPSQQPPHPYYAAGHFQGGYPESTLHRSSVRHSMEEDHEPVIPDAVPIQDMGVHPPPPLPAEENPRKYCRLQLGR